MMVTERLVSGVEPGRSAGYAYANVKQSTRLQRGNLSSQSSVPVNLKKIGFRGMMNVIFGMGWA
jgi:hypothetical protein